MELRQAHNIATKIVEQLQESTSIINIAGSIRREKPEVGDIELVVSPKLVAVTQNNLFDEWVQEKTLVRSVQFISLVKNLGKIIKGKPEGKYIQIELPEEINLDLFIPNPEDYFRQYCVRTGSADFVAKFIARGWRNKLWCGSDKGLRKIKDCQEVKDAVTGKSKWKCFNEHAEKPPTWESEEHFFHWLGLKWIQPKYRI